MNMQFWISVSMQSTDVGRSCWVSWTDLWWIWICRVSQVKLLDCRLSILSPSLEWAFAKICSIRSTSHVRISLAKLKQWKVVVFWCRMCMVVQQIWNMRSHQTSLSSSVSPVTTPESHHWDVSKTWKCSLICFCQSGASLIHPAISQKGYSLLVTCFALNLIALGTRYLSVYLLSI